MRHNVYQGTHSGLLYCDAIMGNHFITAEVWFHDALPSSRNIYPTHDTDRKAVAGNEPVGTVEIEPVGFEEWFEQSDEDREYISISRTAWHAALEMGR